jgi:O-antigen/teichoic acid export membrane protein
MNRFSATVLRNSAFGLAAQLAMKVLSFAFNVLVIRQLGATDFGQYAAVGAFGTLFLFIADLGLSPYAVREFARWRDAPDGAARTQVLYSNVLWLRLALALIASVFTLTAAWLTGRPLLMVGAIALNSIGVLLYAVQGTSEAALAGFERLDVASTARVLNQLAFVVIGGAALWLGFGYYGLIVANLLGIALMLYACWRATRALGLRLGPAQPQLWLSLLRASLPFGIIGFALGLSYRYDSVLLNVTRSDQETGFYGAAYNLIFSAVVISNVVNTALYPSLTRQNASQPDRLASITGRVLRYLLLLALPIAVGGWALSGQIVQFLFDHEYAAAAPALSILIWVVPFMYLSEFLGYIVVIQGQERRVARAVLVSTGLNVALNTLLVPVFGLMAAAAMTVLTEVVLVGQHAWTLRDLLRQVNWREALLRPLMATLGMGGVVLLLAPWLPVLANVALGALIYGLAALLIGAVGREDLSFLQRARRERAEAPQAAP